MAGITHLDVDNVRLRCLDFGGSGVPVLLLHGLCGTADEWASTATWLSERSRVVAFDQRAHGKSTRRPTSVRLGAFVRDAVHVIESMDLQRAVVVGHSMGGRIALLLAARRPDLLRALVLVEASPAKAPDADENVRRWLAKWPASFASTKEARTFFADLGLAPDAWAANLERNSGRLYPQFDADLMLEISKDVAYSDYWGDWKRVQAPTLLVRGEMGTVPREDYTRMQVLNPAATYAEVAGAGHDVHLESPKGWQKALSPFLDDCTS